MIDIDQMNVTELNAELERLAQQQAELAGVLERREEEEKIALANEIKAMISERRYRIDEIVELVLGRKSRKSSSDLSNKSYVRYANPDNPHQTYVRGRMPAWLTELMSANGYDPASPEHRAAFKEQHLVRVAA